MTSEGSGKFGGDGSEEGASATGQTTVIVSLDQLSGRSDTTEHRIPVLRISRGIEVGRHFLLTGKTSFLLGRSSECSVVVPDASCSRKHAEIFLASSGQVFLRDLGSTNGTAVNGTKLSAPVALKESDLILLGDNTDLIFEKMRESDARAQAEVYFKATRDALTNIYNRRFFEDTLKRDISVRNTDSSGLGLILFDVDHFKKVNDTYGHQAGDEVLKEIGRRISTVIRGEDIFSRVGGEEFALILKTPDPQTVTMMAERMRAIMESAPVSAEGKPLPIRISVGSCFHKGSETLSFERLYKLSDEALYEAKHGGRNRCVHKTYST